MTKKKTTPQLETKVTKVTVKTKTAPATAKEAAPASYHHGDLRAQLLVESIGLLKEKGLPAFGIRELASRCGVSHTAPYRHFETKEAIFLRLAEEGFTKLKISIEAATGLSPLDPEQQLIDLAKAYFDFIMAHPQETQMMFGHVLDAKFLASDVKLKAARDAAYQTMLQVIRNGQLAGILNAAEKSETLAVQYWSAVHGFAMLGLTGSLPVASMDSVFNRILQSIVQAPVPSKKKANPLFGIRA